MEAHDRMDAHDRRTLLVPLDGTEFSRRILDQVHRLFAPDRFRIALLHVADPPEGAADAYRPAAVGPDYTFYVYDAHWTIGAEEQQKRYEPHPLNEGTTHEAFRERLKQELERELGHFRSAGYEASATVHFGDPVTEIVAFAQDQPVDAIAMATHGRTGLGRLLQGSVAQDVFARLEEPIPVLFLRPVEGRDEDASPGDRERARPRDGGSGERPTAHPDRGVTRAETDRTRSERQHARGAERREATLAGIPGTGSLTVARHEDGSLDETRGAFEPDDPYVDLSELWEAQRENLSVTYDGPIEDPQEDGSRTRRTSVFITRILEGGAKTEGDAHDNPPRIDFVAGAVTKGDLQTQRSKLE